MKSNRLASALALAACLPLVGSQAGCSLFVDGQKDVFISANDPTARLVVNGNPVGTGSASVRLDKRRTHVVQAFAADGSQDTRRVDRVISTTGVADVVGTFLFVFPVVGVFGGGFWDLKPGDVRFFFPDADMPQGESTASLPHTAASTR